MSHSEVLHGHEFERGWEVESEIDTKTSFRVWDLAVKITEEME